MALKVLLADDSAAIKKVVQLSLQDLGVELKTVGSGKEVLDAARNFKPDIAFIDVLLPGKSGYECTTELKKDPALKNVPVIVLWSAFMAFDEAKYKSCGADAKLEKPFDVGALRKLVNQYVPKAESNPFASNLDFPNVSFEQPIGSVPPQKKTQIPNTPPSVKPAPAPKPQSRPQAQPQVQGQPQPDVEWGGSGFEDINAFASKLEQIDAPQNQTLPKPATPSTPTPSAADWGSDNEWVRKDLGKFKVPVPDEIMIDESPGGAAVAFEYNDAKIVDTSFLFKPPNENTFAGPSQPSADFSPSEIDLTSSPSQSEAQPMSEAVLSLEELSDIKKETREIIERVVWKVVPEIASQIIKDELKRLLGEEQ